MEEFFQMINFATHAKNKASLAENRMNNSFKTGDICLFTEGEIDPV